MSRLGQTGIRPDFRYPEYPQGQISDKYRVSGPPCHVSVGVVQLCTEKSRDADSTLVNLSRHKDGHKVIITMLEVMDVTRLRPS